MKDKYLIGLANLVNGAMLGYEDKRTRTWIISTKTRRG